MQQPQNKNIVKNTGKQSFAKKEHVVEKNDALSARFMKKDTQLLRKKIIRLW